MANEFKIKNGAIISGSITGVTEPTQEDSTKMASTAWVRLQGYLSSLPIATASVLGAIKIGSGLAVDANGVLSIPGAASGTLRSKQTFTATASQTTFTVAGGYTTGLIDVFLNGVLLTSTSVTASDGSTIVLIDPADIGDIVDVVVYTPLNNGFVAGTTDSLTEGTTNLFFTQARARAAVSGTAGRITYTSGVFDLATSGVTAGSYGSATAVPVVTVDAYGRITSISTSSISGALTFTGDVTGTGTTGTSTALTLANSGVTAGTYNNVATEVRPFTVDAKGRITGIGTAVTITPAWASITGKPTTISGYGITDAYTKTEIDNFLQGLDPKQSVKVATTADITLSGTQTIDGVAVVAGDRVLVKNEAAAADNGIYVVAAGAWTRATDANSAAELLSAFVFVEQGTTNADTGWVCTSDNITLGTTAINFTQFSGTGAYQARLNGTGFVRMAGTTVSYITGTPSQFIKGDGSLDSNTYLTGNQSITLSGDATGSGTTSIAITLANSGVTAGSYGSASAVPVITVDAKGRVTGVTTAAISGALTFTGDVTGTGTTGASTALTLAASGVTAGTYNNVTVNAKGLVTAGSNALYLTGNQTVTISGDASGSGATSITLTLANSGVTAGTYRSVTVDAKGRVTGGTNPTTVSGYGITDFYSQVISGFVVGANSTVTTADTLETAIEKLQGQVNARLSSYTDTLATVTGRGATTSTELSLTGRSLTLSNFYPEYRYYLGGGTDLNWKKIADISIGLSSYDAVSMEVTVHDVQSNYGAVATGTTMRFIVSARRSGGVLDNLNDGVVSGPVADYVRLVKTATGVYEVQARQTANYRHILITARVTSKASGTITYATTPADGNTTGTIYTATALHNEYATKLIVTDSATANSFVKAGGTASQFLKANGTVDSNTYLTTSSAASTYLALSGGTLTGALSGTSATFSGIITANSQTTASNGSINVENADPAIRFRVTGGSANKRIYEWRAVAAGGVNDIMQLRLWNDAENSASTLFSVASSGAATFSSSVTAQRFTASDGYGLYVGNFQVGAVTDNRFYIYNGTLGIDNISISPSTGITTFARAISGTSATFSSTVVVNGGQLQVSYGSGTTATLRLDSSGSGQNSSIAYYSGGLFRWEVGTGISSSTSYEIYDRQSTASRFRLSTAGQFQFNAYTSATAFTGTAVANLAVDSSGNVITVSPGGGVTDATKLPLTGGTLTGQLVSTSTAPFSFQGNSNTGTYTNSTIYANQNNTSGNTANGIFIERGRITDTSTAEIRYFVIGARGGQIQWQLDGTGNSSQTGSVTATSFVRSGGTASQFLKANGSVDSSTYLTSITSANVTTALGYTPYNSSNPSGYITASADISGYSARLYSADVRTISPSTHAAYRITAGFTSWNNNNGSPYADYLHLRSYSDSSGGSDNLIMFLKSGIGMRIWQQSWGSSTAYSSYVDVLHSSNYNSYSPTLTGGGASGTWGINISGTAASETLATVTGRGATTSTLIALSGKVTLGNRTSASFNGNVAGLTINNTAEIRSTGAENPPALTWHYEGLATRHILMTSAGVINVVSPSTENSGVAILAVNGNTVLHAGNYTSYSPSLTGSGASGTWGISISGNANTVNGYYAAQTYTSTGNVEGSYLGGHYSSGGNEKPNSNTFNAGKLKLAMLSGSNLGFGGSWNDVLWLSAYNGGDVKGSHALVFDKYSSNVWVSDQAYDSTTWGTGYLILHSGNYSSYALPITGGSVSGDVVFGSNSSSDQGIKINYGNYISGYGRIRFTQDGTNYNTIHSFSSSWQSGSLAGHSTGAINLSGQNGITFGDWNNCDAYIAKNGNIWGRYDVIAYSDKRVKDNIAVVTDPLKKLQAIRGVTFTRTDHKDKSKRYMGVIAQDLLPVLPEVVNEDADGMYSVAYGNLAGVFIEAFKEQQAQIAAQGAQITELMEIIKTLKGL